MKGWYLGQRLPSCLGSLPPPSVLIPILIPGAHLHTYARSDPTKTSITFWYLPQVDALNSTQLNSTQLNSTQLNSTQPIPGIFFSGYILWKLTFVKKSKWLKICLFQLISSNFFCSSKRIFFIKKRRTLVVKFG